MLGSTSALTFREAQSVDDCTVVEELATDQALQALAQTTLSAGGVCKPWRKPSSPSFGTDHACSFGEELPLRVAELPLRVAEHGAWELDGVTVAKLSAACWWGSANAAYPSLLVSSSSFAR